MGEERDEAAVFSSLSGFSLGSILNDFSVPTEGLANQLGLDVGGVNLGFFNNDERIGNDTGEDYEEEVDNEIREEESRAGKVYPRAGRMAVELKPLEIPKQEQGVRRRVPTAEQPKSVYELFPSFAPKKRLAFTEIFANKPVQRKPLPTKTANIEILPFPQSPPPAPEVGVVSKPGNAEKGQLSEYLVDLIEPVVPRKRAAWETEGTVDEELRRAIVKRQRLDKDVLEFDVREDAFDPVMIASWEDDIMWTPYTVPGTDRTVHAEEAAEALQQLNPNLESDDWVKSIMWTPHSSFRPFLESLPVPDASKEQPPSPLRTTKKLRTQPLPVGSGRVAGQQRGDKFNLSNDHLYETSRDGRGAGHKGVRQTLGALEFHHSYPALKLQLPFYKTRLTKTEARAFHRPPLLFPTNIELRFSRVRKPGKGKNKEKGKDKPAAKGGDGHEVRRTSDLTLKDASSFVLWEFSEEHPPMMSSIGMGSLLVNYYRKRNDQDEHSPKGDVGKPHVLEPKDESPFQKFGNVAPGQTFPVLYNNLFKAPLFRHKPYATDFLVLRSTHKGETKYYLREIKALFVVGQTFPSRAVPGPHSRQITTTIKKRLEGIVYKLLKRNKQERLKISRLMKYFPDQNELQMRGRLKELMEYNRRGEHQGFWRLKAKHTLLPDQEILTLLNPEDVVLCEAMQVGQRHLLDAGYGRAAEEGGEDADAPEAEGLDIEQQLAPWIATKNYMHANQGKAMVKLHGEGDPTGRGEAFSFVRVSMKEIFIRAGEDMQEKLAEADNRPKNAHRYNVAQQQSIYRSEIERIWKAQYDSLSRRTEPELSEEEEQKPAPPPRMPSQQRRDSISSSSQRHGGFTIRDERQFPRAGFSPPVQSPLAGPSYIRGSSQFSRGSSADLEEIMSPSAMAGNQANANRVLRIRRQQADGTWKTEIVRDQNVINVYIKTRRGIEEDNMVADMALPTGDSATDSRLKKKIEQEIARMKRNQERRLTRKNQHLVKAGGKPIHLERPSKPDTTRRCGNCGQLGHMKTNRKCPKYLEFNPVHPGSAPGSALSPPGSQSTFPPYPLNTPGGGFLAHRQGSIYGFPAAVSSPLATSPPLSAQVGEREGGGLKITLKAPQPK